jgi:hypothetical protein
MLNIIINVVIVHKWKFLCMKKSNKKKTLEVVPKRSVLFYRGTHFIQEGEEYHLNNLWS